MRKFMLVIMIGMALAIYLYGVVNSFLQDDVNEVNHIEETTTMVYVE